MALNKNTAAQTQSPAFEAPDDDTVDQAAATRSAAQERLAAAAAQHQATKPAEESASREVATKSPTAGQVAKTKPMVNPLETLKNAFPLEWDTLRNLMITNGNFVDKSTNRVLGTSMGIEILTFQDQWVIGTGTDGDEGKENVRYSDDGVTTTKGEDVQAYLKQLKESGFPKASISERVVLGFAITELSPKGKKEMPELEGTLAQISLPTTSKATFKRYQMDQAFKIGKGFVEPEGAQIVRVDCDVVTRGDMSWTVANFTRYAGTLA
jgi:hypothetical protein